MSKPKSSFFLLFFMIAICIGITAHLDRIFFKQSKSFSPRFLYSSLEVNKDWDLPPLTQEQTDLLKKLSNQKFYYLAKGAHCFAFLSADKKYVIKFHRYASHMRVFPWLTHPFSYQFSARRKKIKEHNFSILHHNLSSYKNTFINLQEEAALLLVHINKTKDLKTKVTLVDKSGAEHQIPLDQTTFIVQERADLIYPTLHTLSQHKDIEGAKALISAIIQSIENCSEKGFEDEDPLLYKNYGIVNHRVIHIDIGDLVKNPLMKKNTNLFSQVKLVTKPLYEELQTHYPDLASYYEKEIAILEKKHSSLPLEEKN